MTLADRIYNGYKESCLPKRFIIQDLRAYLGVEDGSVLSRAVDTLIFQNKIKATKDYFLFLSDSELTSANNSQFYSNLIKVSDRIKKKKSKSSQEVITSQDTQIYELANAYYSRCAEYDHRASKLIVECFHPSSKYFNKFKSVVEFVRSNNITIPYFLDVQFFYFHEWLGRAPKVYELYSKHMVESFQERIAYYEEQEGSLMDTSSKFHPVSIPGAALDEYVRGRIAIIAKKWGCSLQEAERMLREI